MRRDPRSTLERQILQRNIVSTASLDFHVHTVTIEAVSLGIATISEGPDPAALVEGAVHIVSLCVVRSASMIHRRLACTNSQHAITMRTTTMPAEFNGGVNFCVSPPMMIALAVTIRTIGVTSPNLAFADLNVNFRRELSQAIGSRWGRHLTRKFNLK
jgi:hypothetical protein